MTEPTEELWERLRAPFTGAEVGKLPKGPKGAASSSDPRCKVCGSRHPERGYFHVDYVGHAHVTERLNAVDPGWRMRRSPIQFDQRGMAFMEVELTVLGVTHEEVGCAETGMGEWPKLLYSDALTRAAMRFGMALDLWKKSGPGGEVMVYEGAATPRASSAGSRAERAPTTTSPSPGVLWEELKLAVGKLGVGGQAEWEDYKAEVGWSRMMAAQEGRITEQKREPIEAALRKVREVLAGEKAAAGEEPWDPLDGAGATGPDGPEALDEVEGYGDYG